MPTLAARVATLSPSLAFVVVAGVFGVALAVISPPMRWGDENTHFVQSYRVSELHFETTVENGHLMVRLPRGVGKLLLVLALERHVNERKGERHSAARLAERRAIVAMPDDRRTVGLANATYPPLAYAPQALGIALASLVTPSVLLQLYAARLANLAVWIALVASAIRVAPFFKLGLALLALAPMSVFVAGTVAVDGLTSGLAFLLGACLLRLAAGHTASRGTVLLLGVLATALALVKLVYAPLVLLLLAVPAERFGGRRAQLVVLATLLLASTAAVAGWLVFARADIAQGIAHRGDDTLRDNVALLVADPLTVARLVVETAARQCAHWAKQLVDTHWGPPLAPVSFLPLWLAAVALALLAEPRPGTWPSPGQRAIAAATAAAIFAGVILGAFLFWSQAEKIAGVQGRYALPLAPAVLIAACPPARVTLPERLRPAATLLAFGIAAALLAATAYRGTQLYV